MSLPIDALDQGRDVPPLHAPHISTDTSTPHPGPRRENVRRRERESVLTARLALFHPPHPHFPPLRSHHPIFLHLIHVILQHPLYDLEKFGLVDRVVAGFDVDFDKVETGAF